MEEAPLQTRRGTFPLRDQERRRLAAQLDTSVTADDRRLPVVWGRTTSTGAAKDPRVFLFPARFAPFTSCWLFSPTATLWRHHESFRETFEAVSSFWMSLFLLFRLHLCFRCADLLIQRSVCFNHCCLQGAAGLAVAYFGCFLVFCVHISAFLYSLTTVITPGCSQAAPPFDVAVDFSLFALIIWNCYQRRSLIKSFLFWFYWECGCGAVAIS